MIHKIEIKKERTRNFNADTTILFYLEMSFISFCFVRDMETTPWWKEDET